MGLTIRVVGQASKRGVIPRLPAPERLLADAQAWITAEYGDIVRSTRCEQTPAGEGELLLDLHPAADTLSITADAEGRVVASADTSPVGPGYHTFVARLLDRLGWELDIAWAHHEDLGQLGRPPAEAAWIGGKTPLADRGGVERAHLALLGRAITRSLELRRKGASGIHVGTRPGTRFSFDGAIATPLGPRDDAWLEQAVKEPRVAVDIRPWWTDATNARYLLARALVIMWTEIRWRPPADDTERAVADEALRLLRRALPMEPSLPYPWREWDELIRLRGLEDPIRERVAQRVDRVDPARPLVGYRRGPVTIVHEGWVLEVPGSFGERRTAEEWWGGERGRGVTLAAVATGARGMPMSAEAFLSRVAGELGSGVIHHQDGELLGKARLGTDASSGVEVAVLEGFSAVTGRGAAIRIEFEDPDDWQWAVGLWRALRPE